MDTHDPQYPAFQQLTYKNHGPAVVVASYVLLVVAVAPVMTRLITRLKAAKELVNDDWMILGSMVRNVKQSSFVVNLTCVMYSCYQSRRRSPSPLPPTPG